MKADAVITTLAGEFHRYLKNIAPNQNFQIIPNGYDTELMNTVTGQKYTEFHIVFTGLLTKNHQYSGLLSVLEELQDEHSICISFAGQIQSEILTKFKVKLKKTRIVDHGYISHYKAIELMKSADLLLNFIFSGAQNDMISGKTLEYIAKISEKFNLAENAIFQTEVTEVIWLSLIHISEPTRLLSMGCSGVGV